MRSTRRSFTSALTTAALVGGLLAAGTVIGAQTANAAVGPSWGNACTTPLVFVSQGVSGAPIGQRGTQIFTQQYTDTGGNFVRVGLNANDNLKYNSIAFDPIDSYIYGVSNGGGAGNTLIKIDSTGGITTVGLPQYMGVGIGTNHGAFDPAGNFYIGGGSTIYKATSAQILGASNPTAGIPFQLLTTTGAVDGGSDFTYADGFLWSAGPNGQIWKTNLSSLVTTEYDNVVKPIDGGNQSAYGAAWTYGNGTLGFDANAGDNSTGLAVQTVDIAGGTPTFVRQASGPGSGNNDGALCSLPTDLSVLKTVNNQATSAGNPAQITPGAAFTWQIGVANNGNGSSQQFVSDTIPAGVTGVSVTAPNAQCGINGGAVAPCGGVHPTAGQTLNIQYGYLANGGTRNATINATAPPGVSTEFDNTATVTGNEADPTPGNNSATAYAVTPAPSFTMTKSGIISRTGGTDGAVVGDEIDYTFSVTNTSPVALTGLAITDPKAGGVTCDSTAVAPQGQAGSSTVCHAVYNMTQADFDAGTIHNVATANATAPGGSNVGPVTSSFDITAAGPTPAIALTKTATPNTGAVVGTNVGYGFSVQNTGNIALNAVTVTDPMFPGGITCALAAPLEPQQSVTCSGANHAVTQPEFDAGTLVNTATANATAVRGGPPAASQASATVTMAAAANSITVTKTAIDDQTGTASGALAGHTISYSFVVKNTGNVSLTSAAIADSLIGNAATCPAAPAGGVPPNGTITCTAPSSYTVTQDDVDAGSVVNLATGTATFVRGANATAQGMATVQAADPTNSVALVKTAKIDRTGGTTGAISGDKISYGFHITNTGPVSLTSVQLTDTLLPAGSIVCPAIPGGKLIPQASIDCTAASAYTVNQDDVDAGTIPNTATVTAGFVRGPNATASSMALVAAVDPTNSVALVKTATDDRTGTTSGAQVGDTISYGFHITNTGPISLTSVQLTDTLLPAGSIVCPAIPGGKLIPQASIDCTAASAYTVNQDDVDAGTIPNTATVTATFVRGPNATNQASASVTAVDPLNAVSLVKLATIDRTGGTTGAVVGDTISYSFMVTNRSNISLTAADITDTLLPAGSITCPPIPGGKLIPGGSITCLAPSSHTVTQDEFDAGTVPNTATVSATFARGPAATGMAAALVTAGEPHPSLGLVKTATVDPAADQAAAKTGDSITYTFLVTNNGDISVDTVSILDADPDVGTITCPALPDGTAPALKLAPQHSITCTADVPHVITQREFDEQAPLVNTATALARPVRGPDSVTSPEATATVDLAAPILGLSIDKTGTVTPAEDQDAVAVGDTVKYTYVITNTGNVTMYDVDVNDQHDGLGDITCPDTSTRPAGADDGNGLAPGGSITCETAVDGYTVTQADIDYGFVYNTATPTGFPPPALPQDRYEGAPDEFTLTAEPAAPAISLLKSAAVTPAADQNGAFAGDTIAYSFLVTNTGNITVKDAAIDDLDPNVGTITCPNVADPGFGPGESTICTADAEHTVTQAEFDNQAPLVNTATASAQPLRGPEPVGPVILAAPPVPPLPARIVSDPSTATVALGAPVAGLTVVKKATVSPASHQTGFKVGDKISYTFTVTNTGNVTMHDITVSDTKIGKVSCPVVPDPGLAPKASIVCSGDNVHVVTQADVDLGYYENTATTTGTPPPTTHLPKYTSKPSKVKSPAEKAAPGLSLVKTADVSPASHQSAAQIGDRISYSFLVTNTGNVTLTKVGVNDPTGGPVTCPKSVLTPRQSMTCHTDRVRTVTAADVSHGHTLVNKATAVGTPPQGLAVEHSATSAATVTLQDPPATPASTGVDSESLLGGGILILLLGSLLLLIGLRRRTERG